jgi:hypothetical protein
MPSTEATQQATTSQRNKRTRGQHKNACVQQGGPKKTIIIQRHFENHLALLDVRIFLGSP